MLFILLFVPLVFAEYGRLSKSVLPTHYNLSLTFYFDGYGYEASSDRKDTFDGIVSILLNITEPVDRIVLHSKNLNFTKENCYVNSLGRMKNISRLEEDSENEQIYLILNDTLPVSCQEVILHIKYSGNISNDYRGIYKSTYMNKEKEERPIISTQFEPTFAHRLVPCFDEPWMKAIWNVEITHPAGSRALSNMPEKQVTALNYDMKTTSFLPTPIMSSYLLALTISDFEYISDYSESGTLVRVFAPSDRLSATELPLETALKSLSYFEKKFGINYTLPKLDFFPVNNASSAAMENWGLVIFKAEKLLGTDIELTKTIVAHEVAHQWFGNLVTMDWFSDLWLNEGFASLYHDLNPSQQSEDQATWYNTYHDDAHRNENPTAKRQFEKKDLKSNGAVSHGKSSNIVSMLYDIIGPEKFENRVAAYLKDNMYKSVNSTIFYSYLADLMPPGCPSISDFMDPWLEQVGLPLVVVEHFNETHYELTQKRYDNGVLDSLDERLPTPKWNYTWNIPVWFEQDGKKVLNWLKPGEKLFISKNVTIEEEFYKIKHIQYSKYVDSKSLFTQMFKFVSLGIETFANLKTIMEKNEKYISSLPNQWILTPLIEQLHPSVMKNLRRKYYSESASLRAMKQYETSKNAEDLLYEMRNTHNRVLVSSTFIVNNIESLAKNEDLLFEVAKQSEGVGKDTIKAICKEHPKKSIRIVFKQFEKLEEWRQKHTKDVLEVVELFRNMKGGKL